MPRKRRSKSKKKNQPEKKKSKVVQSAEEFLEGYSVDDMRKFAKTDDDSYIIMYQVPTSHLGDEEIMKHYRSKMISALQGLGKRRGVIINVQNMKFGVFPAGENSLIKAFAYKKDTPKGRMRATEKEKDNMSGTNFNWDVGKEANSRFTR